MAGHWRVQPGMRHVPARSGRRASRTTGRPAEPVLGIPPDPERAARRIKLLWPAEGFGSAVLLAIFLTGFDALVRGEPKQALRSAVRIVAVTLPSAANVERLTEALLIARRAEAWVLVPADVKQYETFCDLVAEELRSRGAEQGARSNRRPRGRHPVSPLPPLPAS